MRKGGKILPKISWDRASNSGPGAPSAATRGRLIMGFEFTQQNPRQRQCLVGRGRMWTHDSQGLGKLLSPNPAHKETVYVFCLPKNPLCFAKTCLSWTPNNKHMATSSPDDKFLLLMSKEWLTRPSAMKTLRFPESRGRLWGGALERSLFSHYPAPSLVGNP